MYRVVKKRNRVVKKEIGMGKLRRQTSLCFTLEFGGRARCHDGRSHQFCRVSLVAILGNGEGARTAEASAVACDGVRYDLIMVGGWEATLHGHRGRSQLFTLPVLRRRPFVISTELRSFSASPK